MTLALTKDRPPWPWQEQTWQRLCRQREQGALAHAYLFCGDQGIGRVDFIREFADLLLCPSPENHRACRQCRSCRAGGAEHHPDLLIVEPEEDKKDIGIGQIRELAEFMTRSGFSGLARVAAIPRAERLTLAAANALLKTLEEPAARACLLLAAISPGSVLPTIRSRCQILSMPTPDPATAAEWLREQAANRQISSESLSGSTLEELLEDLLEFLGNRPVAVLAELESGKPSGFATMRLLLLALLSGKASVQQAAAEAVKIGDVSSRTGNVRSRTGSLQSRTGNPGSRTGSSAVFEHLDRISTILIRGMVTGAWQNQANQALAEALPGADHAANLAVLVEFQRQVAEARKLAAGPGNPNLQMLFEGIFLCWRRQQPRQVA